MIDAFKAALADEGVSCDVEEQGRLAIITLRAPDTSSPLRLARSDRRRSVVALARSHGFTNVCIELRPADAALPGD